MHARRLPIALLLLAVGALVARGRLDAVAEEPRATPGALVIVGGGGTPADVRARFLELAGGSEAMLLVFPQASRREAAGADARKGWTDVGATHVVVADLAQPKTVRAQLEQAKALWFSGGSQQRLIERLREADLLEAIRAKHAAGAVVGGTSAGAAAMGRRMLTGKARLDALHRGATEQVAGLGLWPTALVDQHFHKRRRFNRLLSAVLDTPRCVGFGIDERTAVIVQGQGVTVMGESSVLVVDARAARIPEAGGGKPPELSAVRDARLAVLRPGDRWSFEAR